MYVVVAVPAVAPVKAVVGHMAVLAAADIKQRLWRGGSVSLAGARTALAHDRVSRQTLAAPS